MRHRRLAFFLLSVLCARFHDDDDDDDDVSGPFNAVSIIDVEQISPLAQLKNEWVRARITYSKYLIAGRHHRWLRSVVRSRFDLSLSILSRMYA